MLLTTTINAASIDLPSINDVPVPEIEHRYIPAFVKAREAIFIQSGLSSFYSGLNNYINSTATRYENRAKHKYELFAANINMNPHWTYFALGAAHTLLIKRELVFKFKNKQFNRVQHSISIGYDRVYTGIQVSFD